MAIRKIVKILPMAAKLAVDRAPRQDTRLTPRWVLNRRAVYLYYSDGDSTGVHSPKFSTTTLHLPIEVHRSLAL